MKKAAVRSLYICYFGVREPLVQTQVLPYLRQLAESGVAINLLTFEPQLKAWPRGERAEYEQHLAADAIRWLALPYHKRPSATATAFDIINGARLVARLIHCEEIQVIHARGHVAAAIGALGKRRSQAKLLFDVRGFMPEEYVDAGLWPAGGWLYRATKKAERRLLEAADGFVVLTEQARRILFPDDPGGDSKPIEVIPCCVDLKRFRSALALTKQEAKQKLGLRDRRVLIYVGSLGGWYLTEEMIELLATAHEQNAATHSLILTRSETRKARAQLLQSGVREKDFFVGEVPPDEVPVYLRAADIAVSLIKPAYSKQASSPTKFAEYLASGLPVICNAGVGDLDEIMQIDRTGILLHSFDREAYLDALQRADALIRDPELACRCAASVRHRFDLETVGGARYRHLYECLSKSKHTRLGQSAGTVRGA